MTALIKSGIKPVTPRVQERSPLRRRDWHLSDALLAVQRLQSEEFQWLMSPCMLAWARFGPWKQS